jgi:hypothetical protein
MVLRLLITFIGTSLFAQSTFKKGYYTSINNKKEEVYFMSFGDEITQSISFKKTMDSDIIFQENHLVLLF